MSAYVAPASKVFTVAHLPAGALPEGTGTWPQTKCGLVMELAEFWMRIELRPGDRVCGGCSDPEGGSEEQGMLL